MVFCHIALQNPEKRDKTDGVASKRWKEGCRKGTGEDYEFRELGPVLEFPALQGVKHQLLSAGQMMGKQHPCLTKDCHPDIANGPQGWISLSLLLPPSRRTPATPFRHRFITRKVHLITSPSSRVVEGIIGWGKGRQRPWLSTIGGRRLAQRNDKAAAPMSLWPGLHTDELSGGYGTSGFSRSMLHDQCNAMSSKVGIMAAVERGMPAQQLSAYCRHVLQLKELLLEFPPDLGIFPSIANMDKYN